ncbi:hypothetical protein FNV43_RR24592 [Rhamnella rubrinervis]|uniref:Uncharacterized protein n=1 Tax=Rhamnella rubrinervis TaxID=2594499 RepID=A0A8K0DM17_9ROSA|nr:hypothetical protein FNV43_RR24592 [Rhamnella rubrinervis]
MDGRHMLELNRGDITTSALTGMRVLVYKEVPYGHSRCLSRNANVPPYLGKDSIDLSDQNYIWHLMPLENSRSSCTQGQVILSNSKGEAGNIKEETGDGPPALPKEDEVLLETREEKGSLIRETRGDCSSFCLPGGNHMAQLVASLKGQGVRLTTKLATNEKLIIPLWMQSRVFQLESELLPSRPLGGALLNFKEDGVAAGWRCPLNHQARLGPGPVRRSSAGRSNQPPGNPTKFLRKKCLALEQSLLLEKNERLAIGTGTEVVEPGLAQLDKKISECKASIKSKDKDLQQLQKTIQELTAELDYLNKEGNNDVMLGYSTIRRVVARTFLSCNMIKLDCLAAKKAQKGE